VRSPNECVGSNIMGDIVDSFLPNDGVSTKPGRLQVVHAHDGSVQLLLNAVEAARVILIRFSRRLDADDVQATQTAPAFGMPSRLPAAH